MRKRFSIDHIPWWKRIRDHRYIRTILFIILALFLYVSMLGNIIPETLDVRLSQIADRDIRSPITTENRIETEEKRSEAIDAINPVYELKRDYAQNQVVKVNDIFELIRRVAFDEEGIVEEEVEEADGEEENDEQLAYIQEVLSSGTSNDLSDETILTLMNSNASQLRIAQEATANAVHEAMSRQISIQNLNDIKQSVDEQFAISTVSKRLLEAMIEIAQFAIIPNYIYDLEGTERLRQEASDRVEPVMIREGQLLVKEGEMVEYEIYEQLRLVGLLEDSFNPNPYIGLALLVLLMIGMLAYYLKEAKTTVQHNNSHLVLFILIFVVTAMLMKMSSLLEGLDISGIGFIVPVAIGAMLLTTLIHPRISLFTSVLFAVVGSIYFNNDGVGTFHFTYGVYILFSAFAGTYYLSRSNRVSRILRAGFFVSLVNIVAIISLLFMRTVQSSWIEVGMHVGFAFLSGFLAAVLTIGLLPFFEAGFGILSTSRLIELSSPNQPLLRKILTETPGTYHHSVVVGNLSEAACEAVGENGLLARVGAYYHDLGKTRRPHYFIENQQKMANPHDQLKPLASTNIIVAHPYDGAALLREHKMPKEIIDIAEQHHGTSLLKFFYYKAKEESDEVVSEDQFRYPGPKPQTKVAAIVMIADSVEAAVRSMSAPTPEKIEGLVRKIITDKLEDGQFDESDITLKQLNQITVTMCESLKGTFHQRIEYPDDKKDKGETKT
ncbi:HD family phosphohydrolase [Bacillus sp. FJAT-45037]|uniref:HD family phosphohydrolase n=1 Tax=Bacillus sp. FJAT-45037 TaxID=2011007 RepID=UPI000C23D535|nr:HD family phosphohydrolase [Bacillus sp. FJAT-45037]